MQGPIPWNLIIHSPLQGIEKEPHNESLEYKKVSPRVKFSEDKRGSRSDLRYEIIKKKKKKKKLSGGA